MSPPPPAKRRRRNVVEPSDDEDDESRVQDKLESPKANTLVNFLSSPSTPQKPRLSTFSPSPTKPRVITRQQTTNNRAGRTRKTTQAAKNGAAASPKKANGAGKPDARGKTADLKDLFSKQAQLPTRTIPKIDKTHGLGADLISDSLSEDDEISDLKASSASLVSQHVRKRLRSEPSKPAAQLPHASQKFVRPPKPLSPSGVDDESRPWSERFGPRNLDELAVHKRKVADVRRWLEDVMRGRLRHRLLILKGPAGSGKTTTVRLLAKELGCDLLEWRNPSNSNGSGFISISRQFEDFLGRGGKFGSLDLEEEISTPASSNGNSSNAAQELILVEEFPNTFSRASSALTSFRSALLSHLSSQLSNMPTFGQLRPAEPVRPVILVISETLLTTSSASADSFTAHRLLGPEILSHPGVGVIEFNAVAPTFLTKALELTVQKEARKSGRRRTPGPLVLKRLGEVGDIRNAISSLEFLCLKGDQQADWGSKVAFAKPKKSVKDAIGLTQGEEESLKLVCQRESSLGIFHAVGKVVYNKRDERPSDDPAEAMPQYMSRFARPHKSEVEVDSLIDETGTDTQTFISALHENYILSCQSSGPMDPSTPIDYVNECIEALSQGDLLCPSQDTFYGGRDSASHVLRQDEITFQVAVRGMLFSLPNPVRRMRSTIAKGTDAFRMFYPTGLKLWRTREEIEGLVDIWSSKLLRGDVFGATKSITAGASAFLKPTTTARETSWMQRQQERAAAAAAAVKPSNETDSAAPLLSLGSAARQELVLERLPYMAQIARATKTMSRFRDLDKIVTFSGISAPGDEEQDEDAEEGSGHHGGEQWATDRPVEEASPRKRHAGIRSGGMSGMLAQKLVLSDDDIED